MRVNAVSCRTTTQSRRPERHLGPTENTSTPRRLLHHVLGHDPELKAHFSKVLAAVRAGERIGVLHGQSREPVAMIVPYEPRDLPAREIGFLDGKVRIESTDDFDMTDEELLGLEK